MKKYLDLYLSFFRASAMADLEYRFNVVAKVVTDLFWYAAQASVFEVLFRQAPRIIDWDIHSARVLIAVLFLVDACWMILFHENFERLSWKVRRGELDLLLVKPVSAQFMVTMQKQNTSYVINVLLTLGYLLWTLQQLPIAIPLWKYALLLGVGLPVALGICYSFRLMFATLSVIFTNADSINYIWYQLYRLGMRPDPFYPRWLRYVVLTVLPVGFIASVPTRMLINSGNWWIFVFGPVIATALFFISRRFWRRSLTHYASASS